MSNHNSDGEIFNVGYGKPISFLDFIKTIASQTDAEIIFKSWPKFYQQIETGNYYSDNRKIKEFLNWSPKTSYSTGIEKSLNSKLDD
ncbi:MAG: hypothetical protein EPN88_07265 [Bacteroidetes bacterium]|nr:MAG: hypothetical protein EPN88_07265 [Bacteroidota bacterium]